jgi:hypothetical protein
MMREANSAPFPTGTAKTAPTANAAPATPIRAID